MNHFSNIQRNVQNFSLASMAAPTTVNTNNIIQNNKIKPIVEGVFRIVIQRHLKETVDLPEVKIWNILPRTVQTRMFVRVRRYGFFFTHELNEAPMRCVLTRRNYLIVYAKERILKGYAVKLSLAQKINICCSNYEKNFCTIHIKWSFGEISLTMNKEQALDWRPKILEAFEGVTVLSNQKNIAVQTENQTIDQKQNQQNDLSLKQINPIYNKNQAPSPPTFPSTLLNKKVQSANLLNEKHQSQPKISFKPRSVDSLVEMAKTSRTFNTFKPNEQKKFSDNNTVETLKEKKANNNFLSKIEDVSIDYSSTSSTVSDYKFKNQWPDQKKPKNATRSVLRRSLSTSVLDLSRNKCEPDIFTEEPKLLVPRRALGHIERPFATLPNNEFASWYTIIKRYGFEKNNTEFSCFNESPIVTILNPENVQKVRELFKKKIDDQAKIQKKNILSWTLSNDPYYLKKAKNSIFNNNDFLWQRRFFESDA